MSIHKKPSKEKPILIFISDRLVIYFFPFLLIAIEIAIRNLAKLSIYDSIGPTLCAAAIGTTIAYSIYQKRYAENRIPPEIIKVIEKHQSKVRIETNDSWGIRNISQIISLVFTLLWIVIIWLSACKSNYFWWILPAHAYIGFFCYSVSICLTEFREYKL